MLTYSQSKGEMLEGGVLIGIGYSGHGSGRNNPRSQELHDIGPIPRGLWRIVRWYDSEHYGSVVAQLAPDLATHTWGRSGFLIHAENPAHPGGSSTGCIVIGHAARVAMKDSGETALTVVE